MLAVLLAGPVNLKLRAHHSMCSRHKTHENNDGGCRTTRTMRCMSSTEGFLTARRYIMYDWVQH